MLLVYTKGSFMHWKAAISVLDLRAGEITCMGLTVVMELNLTQFENAPKTDEKSENATFCNKVRNNRRSTDPMEFYKDFTCGVV